jgi:hypothetical protein
MFLNPLFATMPSLSSRSRVFPRRGVPALALAAVLCLGLAGCATGDVAMLAEIAGGGKIRVPMGPGGPALTNEGGVQVNSANFSISAEKKIVHLFQFTDSRSRALQSVRVEDVSDTAPALFVEDSQPKLSASGQWRREMEPIDLTDARLHWFATISNSLRVFRFTLTFADGQKLVLHQGAFYPAGIKAAIRQSFGQKY